MAIDGHWLPVAFGILLALSVFLYMILDGYDIGVGLLLPFSKSLEMKSEMIATMGPFWDANETWLVLSVGIILVAFPMAQGVILTALYLPVFLLLLGIIMRGVSYEFRNNCQKKYIPWWNRCFFFGSLVMALSQGYMIGIFTSGLVYTKFSNQIAGLTAVILTLTYALTGAAWMLIKSANDLYKLAVVLSKITLRLTIMTILVLVNFILFELGSISSITLLSIIGLTLAVYLLLEICLRKVQEHSNTNFMVFVGAVLLFVLYTLSIVYTCYPFIVPRTMTVWEGAASIESLKIIFIGAMLILPIIIAYNILLHKVFWGKLSKLSYD